MAQTFHKFRAETFDEAYQQMVRKLGPAAVVVNTTEVTEGGVFGFLGSKMVELTASAPSPSGARRRSLPEKKYQACAAAVGSDETVNETVAYFRELVGNAQARMAKPPPQTRAAAVPAERPRQANAAANPARRPTPIVPFKPRRWENQRITELQDEVHEMRRMLQVVVAESPCEGLPEDFAPQYRTLVEGGMSRQAAADLVASVIRGSDPQVVRNARVFAARLKMEIQKRVSVTGGIRTAPGVRKAVALVGPTGVGKTTNLAKLAAQFAVEKGARVALVTTDTYRVAAPQQLQVYANIVDLPMRVTNDDAELRRAVHAFRDYDLVFIDTAGGSQFNLGQIDELKGMLDPGCIDEVILVLSANAQLDGLRSSVANFKRLRPSSLLFSKLDETRHFGAMFSMIAEAGLPLSYFSMGQNVPDDIELASASKVARLLMQDGGRRVGSSA